MAAAEPCCIGRIGCSEVLAVYSAMEMRLGIRKCIDKQVMDLVCTNAGFFPREDSAIKKFAEENIKAAKSSDYFAFLKHHHADYFMHKYCPDKMQIGTIRSLEPYYNAVPWTRNLKEKTVLIVHPFENTILRQYENREKIWNRSDILPDFDLKTVKAVQTIGDNTEGFSDWFAALDYMKEKIAAKNFDIAILGCGAYAFPLAAFIKTELKKKSIVLGGTTQILFGIKGSRWKNHPVISRFFNEYWVSPSADEVPKGANKVENGCYW